MAIRSRTRASGSCVRGRPSRVHDSGWPSVSHMRSVWSHRRWTRLTVRRCDRNVERIHRRRDGGRVRHIRTVRSAPMLESKSPVGENATPGPRPRWPLRVVLTACPDPGGCLRFSPCAAAVSAPRSACRRCGVAPQPLRDWCARPPSRRTPSPWPRHASASGTPSAQPARSTPGLQSPARHAAPGSSLSRARPKADRAREHGADSPQAAHDWGAFQHEAAAVDRVGRRVYLTEDNPTGGFYRFTPSAYPDLSAGLLEARRSRGTWRSPGIRSTIRRRR